MKQSDFILPEDAAALRQLESTPGFAAFSKKLVSIGIEQQLYGVNMASSIRLSEKQLPHFYKRQPPISTLLYHDAKFSTPWGQKMSRTAKFRPERGEKMKHIS